MNETLQVLCFAVILRTRRRSMARGVAEDLTGRTFNRLTVVARAKHKNRRVRWKCRCSCGTVCVIYAKSLLNGNTRSCGCAKLTHGFARRGAKTPEYRIWSGMRDRCNRKTNASYPDYGGRGIKVCNRWREFAPFLEDMGRRPTPQHSIDRIDNAGNYEPENCRWATRAEQNRNARRCKLITHDGRTMTVAEWSRELGIPGPTIYGRIYRGWNEERLLT